MDWITGKNLPMFVDVETVSQLFGLDVQTIRRAASSTGELVPGVRAINFGTGKRAFWRFSTLEICREAGLI